MVGYVTNQILLRFYYKKIDIFLFLFFSVVMFLFYKYYFLEKRLKLVYLVAPAACRSVNLLRFFQS